MGQPHKHIVEIKAWADGEDIECLAGKVWVDAPFPSWCYDVIYRVKPKNIVVHRLVSFDNTNQITRTYFSHDPNIEYTFDPEGKLLDAKVLK